MAIATPLSTKGRFIVDAHGNRVRLAGVNWYGASQDHGVATGLDLVQRDRLAELIAAQGFNSVRLPFSVWMIESRDPVPSQYLTANQDLQGKNPLGVYDACVNALTKQGLIVIPNCHLLDFGWCCSNDDTNGLWFNDRFSSGQFKDAWRTIASRYASNPLVAGMDIKNEPRTTVVRGKTLKPTWGDRSPTDLAAMYKDVGDAIHQVNPDALIICEGKNYASDLTDVAHHPVQLKTEHKVVYSMHDYHWGHKAPQTKDAYIAQMTKRGGYIHDSNTAPLWIGEFGRIVDPHADAGAEPWWSNIQAWLKEKDLDWCYWALNGTYGQSTVPGSSPAPGSGQVPHGQAQQQGGHGQHDAEPFGLLTKDWSDVGGVAMVNMLKALM